MVNARCSCGFTEAEAEGADETISDHLLEVFTPPDDRAPDGTVHLEGETALFCACGSGGSAEKLDSHFLEVFTPADSTGRDGTGHRAVATR